MKKLLLGALTAVMLLSVSAFGEATQAQYDEQCCRGGYGGYCCQDCDDTADGEYCGRYGCRN